MDVPSFADLLECRAIVAHPGLAGTLDTIAQAAVDLATEALPVECLRVHAALGGRVPTARPAFAYEAEGCFGLRGDESLFLVRDGTFHWSLGGMPFLLDKDSDRWRVEDVLLREGLLRLTSSLGDRRRTLRASLTDRRRGGDRGCAVPAHGAPAAPESTHAGTDARSALLARKGVSDLESPSPMRVGTDGERARCTTGWRPARAIHAEARPRILRSAANLDAIASLTRTESQKPAHAWSRNSGSSPIRTGSSRRR
jgi:hypothetical protein